jgi:cell wall-associated NlpC family hydrolase
VFAGIGLVIGQAAWAETPAITKAKTEAETLQQRIDELSQQLDAAVEDYDYAQAKLADTKVAAQKTQATLTKAEQDLKVATDLLTQRLVQIYKEGQLGVLDTLVGSSSFSELISRLDLMELLSEQDAKLVAEVKTYDEDVTARKAELTQQLEDEKTLTAQAKAAQAKVQEQLAANQKALAGKEAQIAQLQKEEAARQAKLAAEAKKKAAAARKAELAAALKRKALAAGLHVPNAVTVNVPDSASSSDVVSIAMDYLGTPYVWAGASPSGFDCSGLVMYVYHKVGINLPHSSRLQYGYGVPVARADLRPGDLVFFYNPISHVGIYIGDGKMVNAAGTGKGVRIDDVWAGSYYGACRIIP